MKKQPLAPVQIAGARREPRVCRAGRRAMLARTLVAESVHLDGAQCAAKRSSSCAAVIEGRDVGIVARTSLLQGAKRVDSSLGTDCARAPDTMNGSEATRSAPSSPVSLESAPHLPTLQVAPLVVSLTEPKAEGERRRAGFSGGLGFQATHHWSGPVAERQPAAAAVDVCRRSR